MSYQGLFLHNSLFSSFKLIAHTSKTIGASAPLRSVVTQQKSRVFESNAAGSRRPREQRDDMGPCLSKGGPVSARDRNGRRNPAPPHSTPRDAPVPRFSSFAHRRPLPPPRQSPSRASEPRGPPSPPRAANGAQATIGRRTGMILGRETPDVNDHYVFHHVRASPPRPRAPPTPNASQKNVQPRSGRPQPRPAPLTPNAPRDSNRDRSSARASSAPPTSSPTR